MNGDVENNENLNAADKLIKMKHLMCNHENEVNNVKEVIADAAKLLHDFASNNNDYNKYSSTGDSNLYFKKVNNTEIGKIEVIFSDALKFEQIVKKIWDENGAKNFDPNFIEGKIIRIYDENLVLLQQTYKGIFGNEGRYFYVLAHKKKLDKSTYIITCISLNINDNNKKCQSSYTNPFIKKVNSFSIDIECDEKIKNSSLKKMHINLSGYLIKRENNYVNCTYVASLELGVSSLIPQFILRKIKANKMLLLNVLRENI